MDCKAYFILAALCAQSVLASYYHGPTAKPVVLKSGYLADTHEVTAAKDAHLAALAKESHYGHGGDYSGSYGYGGDSYGHGYAVKYHGPTAIPHVLKSGYLADTHEVAAAKGAHLAALAKESHYGHGGDYSESYGHGGDYFSHSHDHAFQYHGPTAKPVVLKSGYLADTHEVAAAKGAHLAALAKESRYGHGGDYSELYGNGGDYSGSYGHGGDYSESYGHGGDYSHSYGHGYDTKYHGPTAIPHVLKNGHIADTHEVSAAKSEHYAAVAVAKSYSGHDYSHGHSGH